MKKLTVTALTTILSAALILPAIIPAEAATIEDGRKQFSPKAFGLKTKIINGENTFNIDDKNHKGSLDTVKNEKVKTFKKASEHYKALKFMKTYYRI